MRALMMPVGLDWYAIDVAHLREIVANPLVTGLPTAPASVMGVFNLRGDVVPLFDTAALLGIGSTAEAPFAVVVVTPSGTAGLVATGLPESVLLDEPLERATEGTGTSYAVGKRIATLVDLDVLLTPTRRPEPVS